MGFLGLQDNLQQAAFTNKALTSSMVHLESNLIKHLEDLRTNIVRVSVEASLTKDPMSCAPVMRTIWVATSKHPSQGLRILRLGFIQSSLHCAVAIVTLEWL